MDNFEQKLKEKLDELLRTATSEKILKKLAQKAVDLIRKRTKLGYGVDEHNASKSKLKPLSEGYVKARKRKGTDSSTTSKKSNLTLTGDMLKDLKYEIIGNQIIVGWDEGFSHDKAVWNTEKGRAFNNLSKAEIQQLKDYLKELLGIK